MVKRIKYLEVSQCASHKADDQEVTARLAGERAKSRASGSGFGVADAIDLSLGDD